MGEARRRAEKRKAAAKSVKPMTRHRFDLYAIGTRMAASRLLTEEVSYWPELTEEPPGTDKKTNQEHAFFKLNKSRGSGRCMQRPIRSRITENMCFPHTPDRRRIEPQNCGQVWPETPVGLATCAETTMRGFSGRACAYQKALSLLLAGYFNCGFRRFLVHAPSNEE
jgi:hypothetical protein